MSNFLIMCFVICSSVQRVTGVYWTNYYKRAKSLLHHWPEDARQIDHSTGTDLGPFWASPKRPPKIIQFDANNPTHVTFIHHGAHLMAWMLGITESGKFLASPEELSKMTAQQWSLFIAENNKAALEAAGVEDHSAVQDDEKQREAQIQQLEAEINKYVFFFPTCCFICGLVLQYVSGSTSYACD